MRSQPASNDYRDNWDRLFGPKVTVYEALEYCGIPINFTEGVPKGEVWFVSKGEIVARMTNVGVPENG